MQQKRHSQMEKILSCLIVYIHVIRPAGIATSVSQKKHGTSGSVLLSRSQSTHTRRTVEILLIKYNQAATNLRSD